MGSIGSIFVIFLGTCLGDPCSRLDVDLNINIGSITVGEICSDLFWLKSDKKGGIHSVLSLENLAFPVTVRYALDNLSLSIPRVFSDISVSPRFSAVVIGNWATSYVGLLSKVSARFNSADAVFLVGSGLHHDTGSARICNTFFQTCTGMSSLFYPVLGDLKRGEPPKIDCFSSQWKNSADSFSFRRWKVAKSFSVCAWFIDTNRWGSDKSVHWLSESVAKHTCTWTVVVGYHSIHSDVRLQSTLLPILNAHKVDVYISSSERKSAVFKNPKEHTLFLVSGSASIADAEKTNDPFMEFENTNRVAFLHLEFTPKKISYNFHFGDNTVLAFPFSEGKMFAPTPVTTVILSDGMIDIVAFGDWGAPGEQWSETLQVLKKTDQVFLLGDNFYPNGVVSLADSKWASFDDIAARCNAVSYIAVLGNHDYLGSIEAQIDFPLWTMPHEYFFTRTVKNRLNICVWALDTNSFGHRQGHWLSESIAQESSSCTYRIAIGHHPIVTGGVYMHDRTVADLAATLLPLLTGFHMYLSGHEHMSQVLRAPGTSMLFVIAGATSDMLTDNPDRETHPWELFTDTRRLGVLHMQFSLEEATLRFESPGERKMLWTEKMYSNSS